jgi:hypothetical protein
MDRTLAIVLAALVGLGAGAAAVAHRAFPAFVQYQTPFASAERSDEAPPPVARPVVVLLVDGLRLDVSRGLPFLDELRRRGADFECRVGSPSFSLPARGVLWTGAWAEMHGQLLNFHPRPMRLEHLFESARRGGVRTALSASADVHAMFPAHVDRRDVRAAGQMRKRGTAEAYAADLRSIGDGARAWLAAGAADLVIVELVTTDIAGHQWGGGSAGYRAVVEEGDRVLRRLAGEVDLARGVIVVTSDHGHTDGGGHGGDEAEVMAVPLVMAGHGLRAGVTGRAQQIDVAPTLAAILGVPIPQASQGEILDVFDDGGAGAAERARVLKDQRTRADRHRAAVLGAEPRERALADMRRRQPAALAILAAPFVLLAAVALTRRRRLLVPAAVCAAAATLAYSALRSPLGLSTSLSVLQEDGDLPVLLGVSTALAFVVGLAASLGAAVWAGRAGSATRGSDRALVSALTAVVYLAPFLARTADVYVRAGFIMEWALVDMAARFGFYQDALAIAAVGLLSPLVALASGRRSARSAPSPR